MVHVFVCEQMTNLLHSGTLSQVDGPCSAKAVEMILRWRQAAAVEADSSALLCIDIRIIEALHMVCFCLVILSCVGWKERVDCMSFSPDSLQGSCGGDHGHLRPSSRARIQCTQPWYGDFGHGCVGGWFDAGVLRNQSLMLRFGAPASLRFVVAGHG